MKLNSMQSILYGDNLKGIRIHNLNNGNIKAFEIPSNLIKQSEDLKDVSNSGIYFLINSQNQSLYVGQTDNLWKRVLNHSRDDKKEFEKAVLFTDKNNYWSKTYIDYLEWYYIDKLKISTFWKIENIELRNREPNVSEFEIPALQDLLVDIDVILYALGIDLSRIETKENNYPIFYFKESQLSYIEGKFYLLKNSTFKVLTETQINEIDLIKNNDSLKYKETYIARMKQVLDTINLWVEDGLAIAMPNSTIKIEKDILVSSPSFASIIIKQYPSSNGWTDWKNKKGETLDKVYRAK